MQGGGGVVFFGVVIIGGWMVASSNVMMNHCHHCHQHHCCQLLDVVCWVTETCSPASCDLIADGVDTNLKRSLSIINKIDGTGWWLAQQPLALLWFFYMFGSTADGVE